jgi:hypothetical protein
MNNRQEIIGLFTIIETKTLSVITKVIENIYNDI